MCCARRPANSRWTARSATAATRANCSQRSSPAGVLPRLIALDCDPIELPKTEARLRALGFRPESLLVRRMNYAGLAGLLAVERGADVILADLGLSSMQIDDPARGFTFKTDARLDMRMNPSRGQPASALLVTARESDVVRWLSEHSDEPFAVPLAAAIVRERPQTTAALAALVRRALSTTARRLSEDDVSACVRRVFQAIRIEVNDEFSALETFLRALPQCLKPGGRVAILTFHSGEDRRVKLAFKSGLRERIYTAASTEVVRASAGEQRANPRSASAKLRWAVRA
jgi:16S rRNA (cytosine1402-N4)-methyltransferase